MAQKRFLFDLSDEEKRDGTRLVAFAQRLPQVARTGDTFEDDELKMKRAAFARVIDCLWRNESIVLQADNWCQQRAASILKRDPERYLASLSTLKNLDETWACGFLCGKTSLSLEKLEALCRVDPDAWRQLYQYGLVASVTLQFPPECKEIAVIEGALSTRMGECGDRLKKLDPMTIAHGRTLCIDWGSFGVYELIWEEDKATHVVHRPTQCKVAFPAHIHISKQFRLLHNWSDHQAQLVFKPTQYSIASHFFGASEGPNLLRQLAGMDKGFKKIAEDIKRSLDARSKDNATPSVRTKKRFNEEQKKLQKQETMNKARAVLAQRKDALNNKRTLSFVD